MRAVVLRRAASNLDTPYVAAVETVPLPRVGADEVLVRISAAALNRRELWMTRGMYPGLRVGSIIGGDACGRVVSSAAALHGQLQRNSDGNNSTPVDAVIAGTAGRRVVLNPCAGWTDALDAPPPTFSTLGMLPHCGVFAEYVAIAQDRLEPAPSHLSDVECAALPTAGLTAWRAVVTQARVKRNDLVLIAGIGGGVALFALQICVALGARVLVTSSSRDSIARAVALGAEAGFLYTDSAWPQHVRAHSPQRALDCVIDGACGEALNSFVKLVRLGGRIVVYGVTAGGCEQLALPALFLKQIRLQGTTMGSDAEFRAFLAFVERTRLVPIVQQTHALEHFADALRAQDAARFGKICLSMPLGARLAAKL